MNSSIWEDEWILILTGLIHPSDTDNYVSLIYYIIPIKNHIAIYDKTRSSSFFEISVNFYGNVCYVIHVTDICDIYIYI